MTNHCKRCGRKRLDLEKGPVLALARLIYDVLVDLGGVVQYQEILLRELLHRHRISRGTAVHYIDALTERGFLEVVYHGPGARYKQIRAIRRPGAEGPARDPVVIDEPKGIVVHRVPAWWRRLFGAS